LKGTVEGKSVPAEEVDVQWSTGLPDNRQVTVDDEGFLVLPRLAKGLERMRLVHTPPSGPVRFSKVTETDLEEGEEYSFIEDLQPAMLLQGRLSEDVPR